MDNEQKEKVAALASEAKKKAGGIWTALKEKIATLWKSGRKGKAICIGGAVVVLLLLGQCGGESDPGQGESNNSGGGIKYTGQWFGDIFEEAKEDEGVIYKCTGTAVVVRQATKEGYLVERNSRTPTTRTVWVETSGKRYEDGESLRPGFYIRRGSFEYETALGTERRVARYVEVTDKRTLEKIEKLELKAEGKPIKVDVPIKSLCGFSIGATPSSVKSLFKQVKFNWNGTEMEGEMATPFRHFDHAKLTFTTNHPSGGKHLYKVDLEVTNTASMGNSIAEETDAVVAMLEKKFGIKFRESSFGRYIWEADGGNDCVKQTIVVENYVGLSLYFSSSSDLISVAEKKALEDKKKTKLSADAGADQL